MTHFPARHRRPAAPTHRGSDQVPARDVLWGRPIFRAPRLVLRPAAPASPFAGARPPRTPGRRRPARP